MVVLYRRNRYNVTKQCVWDKERISYLSWTWL
jgi:hypothetical protein